MMRECTQAKILEKDVKGQNVIPRPRKEKSKVTGSKEAPSDSLLTTY